MHSAKSHTILFIEPYYGGSHRAFIDGLQEHLDFRFILETLPPRKWKMRMQLAAPWMAERTLKILVSEPAIKGIVCSSLLDVATYRALLHRNRVDIPVGVYFHENQFAYPNQIKDPQSYQFTALNFTSALAADRIAFNSEYNRETFLDGVEKYLRKAADMDINHLVDILRKKSTVLYPGVHYRDIGESRFSRHKSSPVIVWNHRWEHDKDPDTFFEALFQMADEGVDFRLIVLGQSFVRCPAIFDEAKEKLDAHIDHFGFVRERQQYVDFLKQGSIAVSTARHEFFGIAMLEAVRCGCRPLVPDRLAYRELYPDRFRYARGQFGEALKKSVRGYQPLTDGELLNLTEPFLWDNLSGTYNNWFGGLISDGRSDRDDDS